MTSRGHGPGARFLSGLAARLAAADDMAELVTTENGSPITRSRSSNGLVPVRTYRYNAGLAADLVDDEVRDWVGQQTIVHGAPAGVVAAIVPWNAPQVLISNKLAPPSPPAIPSCSSRPLRRRSTP